MSLSSRCCAALPARRPKAAGRSAVPVAAMSSNPGLASDGKPRADRSVARFPCDALHFRSIQSVSGDPVPHPNCSDRLTATAPVCRRVNRAWVRRAAMAIPGGDTVAFAATTFTAIVYTVTAICSHSGSRWIWSPDHGRCRKQRIRWAGISCGFQAGGEDWVAARPSWLGLQVLHAAGLSGPPHGFLIQFSNSQNFSKRQNFQTKTARRNHQNDLKTSVRASRRDAPESLKSLRPWAW